MWNRRFDWLPITAFVVFVINFVTVYVVAVLLEHVHPFLPYISEAGATPPESGIFGLLLNVGALLLLTMLYLRYRHIDHHVPSESKSARRAAVAGIICGTFSALGLSIVGCFPAKEATIVPHLIGAVLAFVIGTVYIWIDSFISWHMLKKHYCDHASLAICIFRFALCGLSILCYVALAVGGGYSRGETTNSTVPVIASAEVFVTDSKTAPPQPSTARIVSAVGEWILAASLLFYFLSLVAEFRAFTLAKPEPVLLRSRDNRVNAMNSLDRFNSNASYDAMGTTQNQRFQA